jgi:hypothetical protein
VQSTTVTSEERVMVIEEIAKNDQLVSTTTVRVPNAAQAVRIETRFADGRVETRTVSRLDDGTVLIEQ